MSAQFEDLLHWKNEEFVVCAVETPPLFEPQVLGLAPQAESTACWRGYVCTYRVGTQLELQDLFLHANNYPPIDEIKARATRKGDLMHFARNFHIYPSLNRRVDYSGSLLVGSGATKVRGVHMGFQSPYTYQNVFELLFERGQLLATQDISAEMAAARGEAPPNRPSDRNDIPRWVDKMFSLSYKDKYPF